MKKYAEYAKQYATYVISESLDSEYTLAHVSKNMQYIVCNKYANLKYAKYVILQKKICRICTPHFKFADAEASAGESR